MPCSSLSKRVLLACSTLLALAPLTIPAPAQAAVGTTTFSVDASAAAAPLPHHEQYNGMEKTNGLLGGADATLMNNVGTSLVRTFMFTDTNSPSEGQYYFNNQIASLNDIQAMGAAPMLAISKTPRWLADTTFNGVGTYYSWLPPSDYGKFETMLTDLIGHYKADYPALAYIEAWNEPDLEDRNSLGTASILPDSVYRSIYYRFAQAVGAVNASLPAGAAPLKLGGPALAKYDYNKLKDLIDYCKANGLQLDYVSWHTYNHAADPAAVKDDVLQIRSYLDSQGMTGVQIYITEFGLYGGGTVATPTASQFMRSAANVAAQNYYYLEAGTDKAFQWVLRHSSNRIKNQLGLNEGDVYPLYNLNRMMSMLGGQRLPAAKTTSGTSTVGIGTNAIAATDGSSVSLLYWNYQNTSTGSYSVTTDVYNLPASFSGKQIRAEHYLIDATTSNYAYNASLSKLQRTSDVVHGSGTSYTGSVTLGPNAIALLVLTPVSGTIARDDFNANTAGSTPSGWTVTAQPGTSAAAAQPTPEYGVSLKIDDTSASSEAAAEKSFTAQSGDTVAEWKLMQTAAADGVYMHVGNGGTTAVQLSTTSAGTILYTDGGGNAHTVQKLLPNVWYDVKVVVHPAAQQFDLYIDGALQVAGAAFRSTASQVDRLTLGTGAATTGTVFFDDVSVYTP